MNESFEVKIRLEVVNILHISVVIECDKKIIKHLIRLKNYISLDLRHL